MPDIAANVTRIRARIEAAAERAGRRPEDVLLVAVTKTVPLDRIREGVACGLRVLGENRVQEAREKVPRVPDVSWHLIGSLQRNKVKEAIRLFDLIHSVDSLGLAEEISRRAGGDGGRGQVDVLLEVHISDEPEKHGIAPEELETVALAVGRLPGIRLRGCMGMAPLVARPDEARPFFRRLRELRDGLRDRHPDLALPELSMGMSNDFEAAIEEGATMIRVGRALFA
jgi:pyridoxal phosphate enzyme (YggS family)